VVRASGQGEWANGMETTRDTRYVFQIMGNLASAQAQTLTQGKTSLAARRVSHKSPVTVSVILMKMKERTRRRRSLFLQTIPHFSLPTAATDAEDKQ